MVTTIRQAVLIALLSLVAGLLTMAFHPLSPKWQPWNPEEGALSLEEVLAIADTVLWIDARTDDEFIAGHIPGAILVNEDDWEGGLGRLFEVWEPDQVLIVYCGAESCMSSRVVMRRLREDLQDENIYYLEGGWSVWQAAGLPVE
jgi:rhodanese-related sulfurtransferase